jgi:alpha-L-rhamnosidase
MSGIITQLQQSCQLTISKMNIVCRPEPVSTRSGSVPKGAAKSRRERSKRSRTGGRPIARTPVSKRAAHSLPHLSRCCPVKRRGNSGGSTRHGRRTTPVWLAVLIVYVLGLTLAPISPAADGKTNLEAEDSLTGKPIWADGDTSEGTVALFRYHFSLPAGMDPLEISIIADTRYEVWLDGNWLGRGPARFSTVRQEFDVYTLDGPIAGQHTLAVLVQYAPNVRRSESSLPAMQASLRAWDGDVWQTIAETDTDWKAIVSPAWDTEAQPVSQLDLIGPMELLDLRLLPFDWAQPAFDDTAWPNAQEVDPTPFPLLSARTIPFTEDTPRAPWAVVESGLLSPGWQLIDLEHPTGSGSPVTHTLLITATVATTLSLEAVETSPISIDGDLPLLWLSLNDERRPDVVVASQALTPGPHTLIITVPPEQPCQLKEIYGLSTAWPWAAKETQCTRSAGRTLAISQYGLALAGDPAVVPTHDPGRRMLLAAPVPGGQGAPQVSLLPHGAEVYIPPGDIPRYVVLDLGRTVHARISLEAEGPTGTIIDAGWDERLTEGRPLPNPGSLVSNLWSQVDSWVLDGTRRALTTLDARSGRYVLIEVFGPGPIYLHSVRAIEESYPVELNGSFASSDALLSSIWQVGVEGLRANMTDAYTDTPWRERGQWWADAMISFQVNRATFGDLALMRRGLRQMADAIDEDGRPTALAPNGTGTMILDFGMQWIEGLHLYWTLSGNLTLVDELYPAAERLAGFLGTYEGGTGLMDVPPAHWSQSALVDWPAVSSRSGESTALNAQYVAILRQMGEMAEALGDAGQAQSYFERSAAVEEAINALLFLPDQGCYAASRLDGELIAPSPHAQAWALRYGIVPPERRESTAHALIQQLSPFFDEDGWAVIEMLGMYTVLQALTGTGRTLEALDLIRDQYGNLLNQGATTWWELLTPNQGRGHSLSHAWGGSPTWFLSSYILGGTATGPNQWSVAPHPADLEYAEGAIPLGSDLLEIAWQHPGCDQFNLALSAPPGSSGEILLPIRRYDALVALDGITIWDNGPTGEHPVAMTEGGLLVDEVDGGAHQVSASFTCHRLFLPSTTKH